MLKKSLRKLEIPIAEEKWRVTVKCQVLDAQPSEMLTD